MLRRCGQVLLLALIYYVAAEISFSISSAPGTIVNFWFPAGIALSSLILYGYWMALGVFIGNLGIGISVLALGNGWDAFWAGLPPLSLVATTSSLQAVLGAWLILRCVDRDKLIRLQSLRAVSSLFIIGGIVVTGPAALINTYALSATGLHHFERFFFDVATWWIGNVVGVVAVAPLVLVWANGTCGRRRRTLVTAALAFTLFISGVSSRYVHRHHQETRQHEFSKYMHEKLGKMRHTMHEYLVVLRSVGGLYDASEFVSAEEFRVFTQGPLFSFTSIWAIGWAPVLQGSNKAQNEYAHYLEPAKRFAELENYNFASQFAFRDALKAARASGEPVMTRTLQLSSASNAVVVYYPVYRGGLPKNVSDRQDLLLGYVYLVVDTDKLITDALSEIGPNVDIKLYEENSSAEDYLFYGQDKEPNSSLYKHSESWSFAGRTWRFEAVRSGELFTDGVPKEIWLVLLSSAFVVLICSGFILSVTGQSGALRILNEELASKQRTVQSLLQTILDSIVDSIVIVRSDGKIHTANTASERIFGFSQHELSVKAWEELVADKDRATAQRALKTVLREGTSVQLGEDTPLLFTSKRGDEIPVQLVLSPFEGGDLDKAVVVVAQDMTDKQLRQRAIVEKEAAVAANKTKSQFVATMSHELRTPLNAIIGYAELLTDDIEDPSVNAEESRESVERIIQSGNKLLSIINSILEISRMESGSTDLNLETIEVAELAYDLETAGCSLAVKNGNRFEMKCQADGFLYTDVSKLRRAVLNLLNNAAKFTHAGRIKVSIQSSEQGWLSICIEDNGIGISEDQLDRIFVAFQQVDSSSTREFEGTGVGLTLAQNLVALLGGRIEVESTPNVGSKFTVSVPQEYSDASNGETEDPQSATSTTIGQK